MLADSAIAVTEKQIAHNQCFVKLSQLRHLREDWQRLEAMFVELGLQTEEKSQEVLEEMEQPCSDTRNTLNNCMTNEDTSVDTINRELDNARDVIEAQRANMKNRKHTFMKDIISSYARNW